MRPDLEPLPARMTSLPIDDRGYPVPWFVAWQDGKPEFRAMDGEKLKLAIRHRLCWVCGSHLGRYMTFVVGPMCGINRTSAEPPSHLECARWSARNCPFLSNAGRKRREDDAINDETLRNHSAGITIARNPGVTLLWTTLDYKLMVISNGVLLKLGEPETIEFYANGSIASREQIIESVESGLPNLAKMAEQEGAGAIKSLADMREKFYSLLPQEVTV